MNYFNYFTEIEDTFIRRRGRHLLLSPMDWALIESWKEMGVPLHVALRGIERAFDSYNARPRRRTVKSLLYCQEEVEAQFAEWQEAQVGAGAGAGAADGNQNGDRPAGKSVDDKHLPFPRAVITEHMERARASLLEVCAELEKSRPNELCEALSRAAARLKELEKDFASSARPDAEKLEESLTALEKLLDEALLASLPARELAEAREAAAEQLQPYRGRMEQGVFEQTLGNLLLKRLRDAFGLPRLSLFYL